MAYVEAEDILKAKKMDLLTYLRSYEPAELVHVSNGTYCTREHDSLRISNGKWCWFSQGIGGRSALDYLIKVRGMAFTEAVKTILRREVEKPPVIAIRKERGDRRLLLPEKSEDATRVRKYLEGRGIHRIVVAYCLSHDLLYESKDHHSAVFIGYDADGKARYAAIRGTNSGFKGEATGSDKHFSFSLGEEQNPSEVHVFESAIDLLSYATMELLLGHDWKHQAYLSLAGVFRQRRERVVPVALQRYLSEHETIKTIRLHLDNDEVGRAAARGIADGLDRSKYNVLDEPPAKGKDVNDELRIRVCLTREREEYER